MIHNLLTAFIDSTKYSYYFGTTDNILFASCLFFGYVGVICMVLMDIGTRDPHTIYSPAKFSWKFFVEDNLVKFILEVILVALAIRFLPDFLNKPMNQFNALLIGLGADRLSAMAKTSRDKLLPFEENDKKSATVQEVS